MTDVVVPDAGNYDFGDKPIPDNFLDDTINKAVTEHRRKESQIASVEKDFAEVLEKNVATNIAANLIGYIHDDPSQQNKTVPTDPDEDDVRVGQEEVTEVTEYGIDEMLIDAVTAHKHRESRTDFVEAKLHELFPQTEDDNDLLDGDETTPGGLAGKFGANGKVMDMSVIASNLVSFLHDESPSKPQTPQYPENEAVALEATSQQTERKKARGSTDLSVLQEEIDTLRSKVNTLETALKTKDNKNKELNLRVNELENKNHELMKEIEFLQNSKTSLALQSNKCIDELRIILLQYQKHMKLTK